MNWETELAENAPDVIVARKVVAAVLSLLELDKKLLQNNASERSISHRLALHLTDQFADFDVDCEYNRDGHEIKRLHLSDASNHLEDPEGSPVFPDIIVHRRGTEDNILVIEIKKSTSSVSDDCDLKKLSTFREKLHYRAALFLRLQCGVDNPTVLKSRWM